MPGYKLSMECMQWCCSALLKSAGLGAACTYQTRLQGHGRSQVLQHGLRPCVL